MRRIHRGLSIVLIVAALVVLAPSPAAAALPNAPSDLQATVAEDSITLHWSPANDRDGRIRHYVIVRDGRRIARVRGSITTWVDRDVDVTVPHRYRVFARDNDRQRGPNSAPVRTTGHPDPPPARAVAPSGLRATVTDTGIDLSWRPATFPGGPPRTYEIERDGRWVAWVWAQRTSWTDSGADRSVAHTYRVYATDQDRTSGPRSDAVVSSPVDPPPPPLPSATMLAAGDIGLCGGQQAGVAALLAGRPDVTFAALGDIAYPDGSARNFADCYHPFFGPYLSQTRPAPGNHEYVTPGASGYFDYFGSRAGARDRGYYSYDLGAWHVVVINSECWEVGGCSTSDRQYLWMQADLAAHTGRCLMAYWHHPVLTTEQGAVAADHMRPYFDLLQAEGGDVVLGGHHHVYERWARTDSSGGATPAGVRSFTVGTGGANVREFGPSRASLEARGAAHGALELTLNDGGYSWQFLRTGGPQFSDSGSDTC